MFQRWQKMTRHFYVAQRKISAAKAWASNILVAVATQQLIRIVYAVSYLGSFDFPALLFLFSFQLPLTAAGDSVETLCKSDCTNSVTGFFWMPASSSKFVLIRSSIMSLHSSSNSNFSSLSRLKWLDIVRNEFPHTLAGCQHTHTHLCMLPRTWFFLMTYCMASNILFERNSTFLLNVGQAAYKLLVGPEGNAFVHFDPSTTAAFPAYRCKYFLNVKSWIVDFDVHALNYLGKFINTWESRNVDSWRCVRCYFFSFNFH